MKNQPCAYIPPEPKISVTKHGVYKIDFLIVTRKLIISEQNQRAATAHTV
jgi:hypothetical protein